ncbi:MAG: hypothetical protein L6Q97_11810, partial [Thermoanaerobaculia bacterium]|nr:hypothetical protein [Thermoanaerobaculia bacterium]
ADFVSQGKVLVLEIFFINCPPCNTHAPHWQNLYTTIKGQYGNQVEFLMLSNKSADNNAAVAQYKISKGLTMSAAGSNGGSLAAVQPYENGQFGTFYGTPTFIIITPGTGEVIFDIRGNSATETMNLLSQEIALLLQLPKCHIESTQGDTLQNYTLTVSVPGGGASAGKTITNGEYSLEDFSGLPNLPFYEAAPAKNNDPLNGVSTFDLVQINKQILGIEPFQHAWQFIAGDANNSGTLTTFDIIELRKLILGVYDSLPQVNSWVFSPSFDTISPLECPAFTAIKKGDVNGNADPAGIKSKTEPRTEYPLRLLMENQWLETGKMHRIVLRSGNSGSYDGLQMAFRFDPGTIQIERIESTLLPDLGPEAWYLSSGRLALTWVGAVPADINVSDSLITIIIRAKQSGWIGESLSLEQKSLPAEAYSTYKKIQPLILETFRQRTGATIWPNPARERCTLTWESAVAENTLLQVLDYSGKVLLSKPIMLINGVNFLEIKPDGIPAGVYGVWVGRQFAGKLLWLP